MKVLIPMTISDCESDCPFWETERFSRKRVCNFELTSIEIPSRGIPTECPLKKFEIS